MKKKEEKAKKEPSKLPRMLVCKTCRHSAMCASEQYACELNRCTHCGNFAFIYRMIPKDMVGAVPTKLMTVDGRCPKLNVSPLHFTLLEHCPFCEDQRIAEATRDKTSEGAKNETQQPREETM